MGSPHLHVGTAISWLNPTPNHYEFDVECRRTQGGYTYADLWAYALNERKNGVTHFAMIHTDVDPGPNWLSVHWRILNHRKAQIVSSVIAMKDMTNTSSTGYVKRSGGSVTKLKLTETDALPPVFSIKDVRPNDWQDYALCLNTGLWLADIRGTWAEKMQWVGKGGIEYNAKTGKHETYFFSEDWLESRHLADLLEPEEILAIGVGELPVNHWGWFPIGNRSTLGIRCRICRDAGIIDNGDDTVPCPECQPVSSTNSRGAPCR